MLRQTHTAYIKCVSKILFDQLFRLELVLFLELPNYYTTRNDSDDGWFDDDDND